jgi:tRNA dimethylallyltransferase
VIEGAVLIAGPTASGKSRLALDWAQRTGGVIVNADSMQVYSDLRVLTARPGLNDLAAAPHLLYGHVDASIAYSTGQWLRDAMQLLREGAFRERTPIFVGGTGLYFRALTDGLSAMPDIPEHVRTRWRYRLNEEGASRLHRALMQVDPAAAMRLQASDGQRIVRALEIFDASGRSVLDWQNEKRKPLVDPASTRRMLIKVDRDVLRDRINTRFDAMIEGGALQEVDTLLARGLDPALPAMRAIGVPELAAHLRGEMPLDEAVEKAKAATRQYAKRQLTWFRNQTGPEWESII